MKRRYQPHLGALVLIATALIPKPAAAQSGSWIDSLTAAGTYNWSATTDWTGGIIANGANNTATFNPNAAGGGLLSSDILVNLDTARTIGNLVFDNSSTTNTAGWRITGNTLTLSASGTPTISVSANSLNPSITATITAQVAGTQGLAINGPGILFLLGNNTGLSGGITVNSGVLQVTGSAGVNPLGSNQVTLAGGTLRLGGAPPITLASSFFNEAMVLPGPAATTPFSGNITATMTGGTSLTGSTFYLKGTNSANTASGLPMGTTSNGDSAHGSLRYLLQPAVPGGSPNNALFFANSSALAGGGPGLGLTSGTMTFTSPVALTTIGFLGASANTSTPTFASASTPTLTATINYADGTASATGLSFQLPDWLDTTASGYSAAFPAKGRVNAGTPPTYQVTTTTPNLWDALISNPNPASPIASIGLAWAPGTVATATTAIFSVGGTIAASVAQNFSGNNIVVTSNSTIDLAAGGAATVVGNISIGTYTLSITNGSLTCGGIAMTGNPTVNIALGSLTPGGPFSDGGTVRTLTLSGSGTLVAGVAAPGLSAGTNVVVNAGTLNLNNATAFGPSPNVSVSNVGSLVNLAAGTNPTFGALSSTAPGGVVVLNGNTLTISGSGNSTFNGTIQNGSAAGSVVKTGSGTQTFAGTNTFTGGITITGGLLVGTVSGSLSTGPINLAGGNLTVGGGAVSTTTIAGFGGSGTGWTTNAANATGSGTSPAGTAIFPAANTLQLTPNAGNAIASAWYNTPVPLRPFTLNFTYSVPVSVGPADGITFGFQNVATNPLNAIGGGNGGSSLGYNGITPSVAEEINIYPPNTAGGVGSGIGLLTGGENPASFLATSTAPVNAGTTTPTNVTLTYDGTSFVVNLVQGVNTYTSAPQPVNLIGNIGSNTAYFGFTGATGGSTAEQIITNLSFNSPVQNTFGNNVTLTAPSGTINVLANAAVSTVNLGTLTMAANSTLSVNPDPSNPAGLPFGLTFTGTTLNGAAAFIVANTAAGKGTLSLGPVANGTGVGSIALSGGGTLILGAPSTYTGGTTVNAGTLQVANASGSATGTGPVTIASGGTLTGGNGGGSANPFADSTQGFISGAVTVQAGGFIFRGVNGPGLLTVNGGVNFQAGSAFSVYLASNNPRPGTAPIDLNTNSRVATPLDLLFGGSLIVPIDGGGQSFVGGNTYDFFIGQDRGTSGSLPSSVTFMPTDFASPANPGDFALSRSADGRDLILTFNAVPEPGTLILTGVAGLGVARFIRRRRR